MHHIQLNRDLFDPLQRSSANEPGERLEDSLRVGEQHLVAPPDGRGEPLVAGNPSGAPIPGRPIVSSTPPGFPDDLPIWSPCSSTLIYGEHDAVLVDAFATFDQADVLADWVETRAGGSHIYITHGHGDHWLGLARLIQRFPGATGLATSEVPGASGIRGYGRYGRILGGDLPRHGLPAD